MWPRVISIDLAAMTGHRLCHSPHGRVARAQKLIPQHGRSAQFGVVPCEAAHIVAPFVARCVVGMHHVAIVEKAIPAVALNFSLVELHDFLQLPLDEAVALRLHSRQAPDAEGSLAVQIFGGTHQLTIGS